MGLHVAVQAMHLRVHRRDLPRVRLQLPTVRRDARRDDGDVLLGRRERLLRRPEPRLQLAPRLVRRRLPPQRRRLGLHLRHLARHARRRLRLRPRLLALLLLLRRRRRDGRRCRRRRRRAFRLRERSRECGLRSVRLRRTALRLLCCDAVPLRELGDHTAHLLLQSPSLLLRLRDLERSGRGRFVALALHLRHLRRHRSHLTLRLSRCASRLRKCLVALAL